MPDQAPAKRPRVVIIGAGFAGLYAARKLGHLPVEVILVDYKNHHTFQPLLYQVATAGLAPQQIAYPIRAVLRRRKNVTVLLGEAQSFDLANRRVIFTDFQLEYDYLLIAAGATHAYFGHDEWAPIAPGLKTVEDAIEIRRRVLLAFELAERQELIRDRDTPLNFVIVGAGPTGVELAGTLADIAKRALSRDFRGIDPARARVLLLEGGPRVLPTYPEDLSRSAEEQLRKLGVEVHTSTMVTKIEPNRVHVGERSIPAALVLWAAGVAASPLGRKLGVPTDRVGRVLVESDLTVPGHREVFVAGDLAAVRAEEGKFVPGVAPAAIQMGNFVAETIERDLKSEPRRNFVYWEKGSLATIGRAAAVADFGKVHMSGWTAWMAWLLIHLYFLIGFRNRVIVMMEWAWAYFTHQRGARLITGETRHLFRLD